MLNSSSSKVVIRMPEGAIKGFVDQQDIAGPLSADFGQKSLRLQLASSGEEKLISLENIKGVFFVRDFEGNTDHADIRFHDGTSPAGYLWVRLTFRDGEVLEGMIDNSCDFIIAKGIWITPSDPTSNNLLVYASKTHMSHFEILGLRQTLHRRIY